MNYTNQSLKKWGTVSKKSWLVLSLLLLGCASVYAQKKQKIEFVGNARFLQVGDCTIPDDPYNVKLLVRINSKTEPATVTIEELWEDKESGKFEPNESHEWSGEILNAVCLRLQAVASIECKEEKRTETLHFIGVINCQKEDDYCTMRLEDTFAMCPVGNCIFSLEYDLKTYDLE